MVYAFIRRKKKTVNITFLPLESKTGKMLSTKCYKANLKTVTIPKNVTKIGNMAFAFSKGIGVTCEGDTAISIDPLAFYDCGDTSVLSSVPAANALRTVKIKLAKPKHHAVYLKWTKADGADGYQIYRKSARGKYVKVKTVSNKYLHKTLTGMKSKKLYTFKVRAYVKVSGKTYYSHFSKGKSAIVK